MDVISAFLNGSLENLYAFFFMVVITLGIVVTVHEFGHFITARFFGVRVEEFSFGFGKEVVGVSHKDSHGLDTRFSIRLFPLGGYVKLFGDIDPAKPVLWDKDIQCERPITDEEKGYAFYSKSAWKRFIIVAAGPIINILLTMAVLTSVFTIYGQRSSPTTINFIAVDSAAQKAGIHVGDTIIAMDGNPNRRLEDIYDITWHENPAKLHTYKVLRDGEIKEISFKAKRLSYETEKGIDLKHGQTGMVWVKYVGFKISMKSINGIDVADQPDKARDLVIQNLDKEMTLGIESFKAGEKESLFIVKFPSIYNKHLSDPDHKYYDRAFIAPQDKELIIKLPLHESISRSFLLLGYGIIGSYKTLEASINGKNNDPVISGVSKISESIGKAVKAGIYDYIMMLAIFSFMIGFINILPIPALDGGYLVFLIYEIVRGKPIPTQIQTIATITGLVILIGIMVLANVSDLMGFISDVHSD